MPPKQNGVDCEPNFRFSTQQIHSMTRVSTLFLFFKGLFHVEVLCLTVCMTRPLWNVHRSQKKASESLKQELQPAGSNHVVAGT